jgi:hypothetical protein
MLETYVLVIGLWDPSFYRTEHSATGTGMDSVERDGWCYFDTWADLA